MVGTACDLRHLGMEQDMTKDEALDLAQGYLDRLIRGLNMDDTSEAVQVRDAIKQARSAPVQEPVAWGMPGKDGFIFDVICPEEHTREEGGYTAPLYTTPPTAKPAPVQERTDYAVHLNHCNIGECEGVCKYLDDDCPALKHADMKAKWDRPTPPAAQRQWVGLTDDDFQLICTNFRVAHGGWVNMLALEIEAKLKEKNT